jgi:hypothetical protein
MANWLDEAIDTIWNIVTDANELKGKSLMLNINDPMDMRNFAITTSQDLATGEYLSVIENSGTKVIKTLTGNTIEGVVKQAIKLTIIGAVPLKGGMVYLTSAVIELGGYAVDHKLQISNTVENEWRLIANDIAINGFGLEEIIKMNKSMIDINNYTAYDQFKFIHNLKTIYLEEGLYGIFNAVKEAFDPLFDYRKIEKTTFDDGTEAIKYEEYVAVDTSVFRLPPGYTSIIFDEEVNELFITDAEGNEGYISAIDTTSSGDGAWVIDGNIGTDDNDSILGTLEDDFIYGNYNALLAS